MKYTSRFLLFCLLFTGFGTEPFLSAQVPVPELVKRLGHKKWEEREKATRELLKLPYSRIKPFLEKAQENEDAEIRHRAAETLLLSRYRIPLRHKAKLLNFLSSYSQTPQEETAVRISILQAIRREAGSESLPMLFILLSETTGEFREDAKKFLIQTASETPDDSIKALETLSANDRIRLGELPALLYLETGRFSECEDFLVDAVGYISFEEIGKIYSALNRAAVNGQFTPRRFPEISRNVFLKFGDYVYTEPFDAEHAIIQGEHIKEICRHDKQTYYDLMYILTELGDTDTGVLFLKELLKEKNYSVMEKVLGYIKPVKPDAVHLVSYFRLFAQHLPAAEEMKKAKQLAAEFPEDQQIHYKTGIWFEDLKLNTYADNEFQQVVIIKPDETPVDFESALRVAEYYYQREWYKKAKAIYELALRMADKNEWAGPGIREARKKITFSEVILLSRKKDFKTITGLLAKMGDKSEAEENLVKFCSIFSGEDGPADRKKKINEILDSTVDPRILFQMATLLKDIGMSLLADDCHRRVMNLSGEGGAYYATAAYYLAHSFYMRLDFSNALALFTKSVKASEEDTWLHTRASLYADFCRIRLMLAEGSYGKAMDMVKAVERGNTYSEENSPFENLEFEIIYARVLLKSGRKEEKQKRASEIHEFYLKQKRDFEIERNASFWLNNIAWYLARAEEMPQKAVEYSRKSLEQEPDTSMFLDTLAESYSAAGDIGSAIENTEKAIRFSRSDTMTLYYKTQLERFKNAEKKKHGVH